MRFRLPVPWHLLLAGAAVVALVPAGCVKRQRPAASPAPAAHREVKAAPDDVSWEVRGWGKIQEEAEQDALRRAAKKVTEYLRGQKPAVRWTPTPEYVREHFLSGDSKRAEKFEDADDPLKLQCWIIRVSISPEEREAIARLDAQYRVEQRRLERAVVSRDRMLVLGKVLVAVVAGLLALLAYLRVDGWTKGYYSRWLAAGAAGFLAAVGLGIWFWS